MTSIQTLDPTTFTAAVFEGDRTFRQLARIDEVLTALERGVFDPAPLTFDGTEIPRLDPDKSLAPIANLDELLDLLGRLVHKLDDADDFERALDGLCRLCDQRPPDFAARTAPLRSQVEKALDPSDEWSMAYAEGMQPELLQHVFAWLQPIPLDAAQEFLNDARQRGSQPLEVRPKRGAVGEPPLTEFLALRGREVVPRITAGIAAPLLSAPTHRGGWIDPIALTSRLTEYLTRGLPIGELDGVLALLRLAPDHRSAALEKARRLPAPADPKMPFADEFPRALCHALGEDTTSIGPTASLWVAAARARSPRAEDSRVEAAHPGLGPDAGQPARVQVTLGAPEDEYENPATYVVSPRPPTGTPFSMPTVLQHRPEEGDTDIDLDPRVFTVWPLNPDALLAQGVLWMADRQERCVVNNGRRQFLDLLLDPDVPLGRHATQLLALGLTAKDGAVQGLAVDVLIASAEDGRLDPERLGTAIGEIASKKLGKYSRWARTLAAAARVSPLHTEMARRTVQRALQGDAKSSARAVIPLVELFLELCTQCGQGVDADATRAFLDSLPSGKAAKAAQRALSLEREGDPSQRLAAQSAMLEQRIGRAERWMRRRSPADW